MGRQVGRCKGFNHFFSDLIVLILAVLGLLLMLT
jgi:hypothetical protein